MIAAFSVGILGSFHCIGMCGAIALALPIKETTWMSQLGGGAIYNLGRITTYGILGGLLGLIGRGLSLAGFQQGLSIGLGVLLLVFLLFPKWIQKNQHRYSWLAERQLWVKAKMGKLFQSNTHTALFAIGLLNGLLPCGLVYVALAGAMATGQVGGGALYMVFFGLGTAPMMLLASQFRSLISMKIRNRMRKMVPVFVGAMAILFIMRGLNLGIPYVSPVLQHRITAWILPANCH